MNEFEFGEMAMDSGDAGIEGPGLDELDGMQQNMELQGPPPLVYNLQPPMGVSVTTPATVPQAYPPQHLMAKPQDTMLGSGTKGPDVLFRVQMGLQSGVASEIDWCLTTLLTFTTARNFDVLKVRVDIMLSVIAFINAHWDEVTASRTDLDDTYEVLRTRQKVLDALLIIRNVCIDQSVAQQLAPHVARLVELGVSLPLNSSLYTEMRLLCLETCEHVCFYLPAQGSESALFQGLVTLVDSRDKSVLVSALRSLTRLLVFDVRETSPLAVLPQKLKRVASLLLVDDADLDAAALDLLQQVTARLQRVDQLAPLNPTAFVAHLVRLLSFRMERGPSDYLRLPRRTRRPAPVVPPEVTPAIMAELLAMNEPERATMWIRSSYDTDPDGEVMQVALWTGYQRAFEPHERNDEPAKKMLKAIDFIRTCTTNVRGAQAKVVTLQDGQRKFIIKGLVPREKAVPPSQLLGTAGQAVGAGDQQSEDKTHRAPPVFGPTAANVLLNIERLQGGKELVEPLVSDILASIPVNPAITEHVDRLLAEIKHA